METKIYVTTTIPYVNARPHIGFALELIQADVIARYHRLLGIKTRFQTGTDENALKNVLAAREAGLSEIELVNKNSGLFKDLEDKMDTSANVFLRTTEERHSRAVNHFWSHMRPDDIYLRTYSGLYCNGCEDFYLEKDLIGGKCPDHGTKPVYVDEINYFFRLSAYQERLEDLIGKDRIKIIPNTRKNEIVEFIKRGLNDISISRSARRFNGWGIYVTNDHSQVVYVWIDALINYLSGLGYGEEEDWSEFWNNDTLKVHIIGKNVWKFHAVYWPAILLSAGLALPNKIFIHGFLTENGKKISKSSGVSIDPVTYIEKYGVDSVRYYLLRAISPFEDGDFSSERLEQLHNSDLANNLGNLLNRITTLCQKAEYGCFNPPNTRSAPDGYHDAITSFEYDKALKILWSNLSLINRDIDGTQPWRSLKSGNSQQLKKDLTRWLNELYIVGYWLAPFLPETSKKIMNVLLETPISTGFPLFPRLDQA
ncbi:methionine--tRNA ligase [Thermodesulfobacteriota bacterium]